MSRYALSDMGGGMRSGLTSDSDGPRLAPRQSMAAARLQEAKKFSSTQRQ